MREVHRVSRMKAIADEHLIVREYYNPNKFDVIFERLKIYDYYVNQFNIMLGPLRAVLKANDFLTLPHGYYKVTSKNGAPLFDLVINYGDARNKGNKLPSLPVVDHRFQK